VTIYLTAEQVLFIHYRLVSETAGEHGVRDIGLLESAVARPKRAFLKSICSQFQHPANAGNVNNVFAGRSGMFKVTR
jgi:prophage maintenance system killer protein